MIVYDVNSFENKMLIFVISWFVSGLIFSIMTHTIIKKKDLTIANLIECVLRSVIGLFAILDFCWDYHKIHRNDWKFLDYPIYKVKRGK